MTIWNVPPVDQQGEIELEQWGIALIDDRNWHFIGYNMANWEGRASTRIVRFDAATMTGITASGRVYRLKGPPGPLHPDARYVFERWCAINRVERAEDITARVMAGDIEPPDDRH